MTIFRGSASAFALLMVVCAATVGTTPSAEAAGEGSSSQYGAARSEPAPFQVAESTTTKGGEPTETELLFWESVKNSQYPEELQAYLDRYPDGAFADLARIRLKRLSGPEATPAASPTTTSGEPPVDSSSTPLAAAQSEEVYEPHKRMWVTRPASVRAGPSTSHKELEGLKAGQVVGVVSRSGDWYELRRSASKPRRFVYAPALSESNPARAKFAASTERSKKTAGTLSAVAQGDEIYEPYKKMWAAKRADVHTGPSTSHDKIDLLEVGKLVYVASRKGDWLRLWPRPGQDNRFVRASLLTDTRPVKSKSAASTEPSKKAAGTPPEVAQGDEVYEPHKRMWVTKRADVYAGPSTGFLKVDLLEVGKEVRVVAREGGWFKLWRRPGQGRRFVYAPLLTDSNPKPSTSFYTIKASKSSTKTHTRMWVAKRANVRAGPSTSHRKVDLLEVGEEVRVVAKEGDWFKLWHRPGLGRRFVYAPLLTDRKPAKSSAASSTSNVKTINYSNGDRYRGEVRNGKRHGHGVYTFAESGDRYEGDWVNGECTGRGVMTYEWGARYEGDWVNGQEHGHGTFTISDGSLLQGDWVNGNMTGPGVIFWPKGESHIYRDPGGSPKVGIFDDSIGRRYEGEIKDMNPNGRGVLTLSNGKRYEGNFVDGHLNGYGVLTYPKSWRRQRYEGNFVHGRESGHGKLTWSDGDSYEGPFRNGKMHGVGVFRWANGKTTKAEYREGQYVSKSTSATSDKAASRSDNKGQRSNSGGNKGTLWGAVVIASAWDQGETSDGMVDFEQDMSAGVSYNYSSKAKAIERAIEECSKNAEWVDCGRNGAYNSENSYATHVVFSTGAQSHDSSLYGHVAPGIRGKHRGKSSVVRHRCTIIWSELDTTHDYYDFPNTPMAVFADSESEARSTFRANWSDSANVSSNWRNEVHVYCNNR